LETLMCSTTATRPTIPSARSFPVMFSPPPVSSESRDKWSRRRNSSASRQRDTQSEQGRPNWPISTHSATKSAHRQLPIWRRDRWHFSLRQGRRPRLEAIQAKLEAIPDCQCRPSVSRCELSGGYPFLRPEAPVAVASSQEWGIERFVTGTHLE